MTGIAGCKSDHIQIEFSDYIHGVIQLRAVDNRAARSLIPCLLRKLTDHSNFAAFLQRKNIVFIFQQNDALLAALLRKGMVCLHIKRFSFQHINRFSCRKHDIQQFIHANIHFPLGNAAFPHCFYKLVRAISAGRRHFQMAACPYSFNKVVVCAPVRNYKTVKSPVIPQDLLQKVGVFIGVDPVDHVVGRHDGFRMPFFYGNFKVGQVDFTKRALIHYRVGCHPAQLNIISCKMLWACRNPVCLDTADIAGSHLPREIRILGKILKITPTERIAFDV